MARNQAAEQDVQEDVATQAPKQRSYGVNHFTILGRMTSDPLVRFTSSGKAVLNLGLATSAAGQTTFHDLTAWERAAEILGQYGRKGRELYVEGRLATRVREVEGHRIKQVDLVVESFQLIGSPLSGRNGDADVAGNAVGDAPDAEQ